MNGACWVDGVPSTSVNLLDRGLHYGDGLFETLSVRDGRIQLLDYHLQRLRQGCERLSLTMPKIDTLHDELHHAAKDQGRAVLKLIVTRGAGGRGYGPPQDAVPTRIVFRYPQPDYPADNWEQGVRLRVCDTRLGRNPRLAGLKHLNRLEQVLARSEWNAAEDVAEGLMLDEMGLVIEGTMSNVFAEPEAGVLATPALGRCGVAGVMRRHLLEQAQRVGMTLRIMDMALADLMQAREIFVCNSVIGVWPVMAVGERRFTTGATTRQAQQWASRV
jgi:4-amino-4-deoxychorismate lyase